MPAGNEDPVGAPACVSSDTQGRSCDGAGTCMNREGQRQAVHGGRPVHERLLHRRRLLQQPVRPDLLPVRRRRARRDLLPGPDRPARPQRHHAVRRRGPVLQRRGHLRDRQEAERRRPASAPPTAAALLRRRRSAAQRLHRHLPVVHVDGAARRVRNSAGGLAGHELDRRLRGRAVLRRRGHLPVGQKANGLLHRGTGVRLAASASTASAATTRAATPATRATCQARGPAGRCAPAPRTPATPVASPSTATTGHACTMGKKPERRDLRERHDAARTTASTAPAARAPAPASAAPARTRREPASSRPGRHGSAQ